MNRFQSAAVTSVLSAALMFTASPASAQIAEKKSLDMERARRVIAAAVVEANAKKITGVIAVVDAEGNLIASERIDGTFAAGANDLRGPNGIAFSPDEKHLYVTNWDEKKKAGIRYGMLSDGTLSNGRIFFHMTAAPGEDALDGMKVDRAGNLYVSGPGGLWILSPEGKHLGTVIAPKHRHNFAWGDDGRTLYLCARSELYRMRLNIEGIRP